MGNMLSYPQGRYDRGAPSDDLVLPPVSAAERERLLIEWNATQADYAPFACLHHLFEDQTARSPDAIALIWSENRYTYTQLNQQANQLAHHLRARGIGPGALIGLYLDRSIDMIVGLLAILKAGGGYVPLDPNYPHDRIAFTLADTQAPLLVTNTSLLPTLSYEPPALFCFDRDWAECATLPTTNLTLTIASDQIAYVIYTSGSTGQPKGVAIAHRNAANLVGWARDSFRPADLAGVLAGTSLCFDLSIFELFVPWSCGGTVILVDDVLQLTGLSVAEEVTLINTVPSAMSSLLQLGVLPTSVRCINLAGEPLPGALVQQLYSQHHIERVCNLYGPTETTTYSTWAAIPRDNTLLPTIGRPVANTQIYLLDAALQPVPIGTAGELYIGGAGVALGYLNRAALTAERFIPDPFTCQLTGGRLYRTGDLARYRSDSTLEYIGRTDQQVKIRGFRIELGEIEEVLRQHKLVHEVAVLALEDERTAAGTDRQLVAYIVPSHSDAEIIAALRSFARERLPEYMVPALFQILTALPHTPNGKVDRRALPAPHWTRADDTPLVVPQTPTEELVAAVWADVLRLPALSRHDDFFALGGHSLLATQVVTRLRAATGHDLAIRALFQAPTVAALAAHLDQQRTAGLPALAPPRAVDRPAVLPLAPAQQRLWFLAHWHGPSAAYTEPLALTLHGPLQLPALEHSLDALVARHEPLRTTFPADATGQPAQHIAPSGTLPLVRHDLRHLPAPAQPAAVRDLCASALQQPFDLANGPLVRAWLVHLGPQHHQLLLAFHHIIIDGWSFTIVLDELAALYRAACQQESPDLPPLALQYADYALWQQQVLLPAVRDRQLAFWQQHLAGAPPTLDLPTDHPRPAQQDLRGATARVSLDPALVAALTARSRVEHVTLFMTLFSAFQLLLLRLTGQTDLVVGTPVANRTQPQLEPLIGFFVNTLALRTDLAGTPTLRALLHHVREVTLDAAAQQDLPFEQVVEALQPVRDPSRAPLVQVMFVLQNVPRATRAWPELTVTATPVTTATAKFDLTLIVEQVDDGLDLSIEYSTALFTAATVARLAAQYGRVLHAFASDVDQSVWAVSLLSVAEQQQVRAWSTPRRAYAAEQTIHALFAAQAARTPAAVALRCGDAVLSYGALEAQANQLAHYLHQQGVGPETRVGVCLERGSALIVALLAVLKADGVYVPLDPAYPAARLTRLLDDAQVALVLSERPIVLPRVVPRHDLDTLATRLATLPIAPPPSRSTPDHLAYVIYTSGTTGQPKGVAVPHQGICNVIAAQRDIFQLSIGDTVLPFASISFDASIFEILMALLSGAALRLAPRESLLPGPELIDLLREWHVTHITITPSALAAVPVAELPELHTIAVAAEPCSAELVERWGPAKFGSDRRVFNLYGPTETSIWATVASCYDGSRQPDIGHPIGNNAVYLLDPYKQPVPIGVTGELYIGGVGVARGYLNQPALTAERFIPDPFSDIAGMRMYRTGDLGRLLADGAIDYLGRADEQIKLRGFRIELGEIEHHLLRAPAVRDAVVAVRADPSGTQQLVAYVVGAPDAPDQPQATALRALLQTQMPDYMIPAAFVLLDALPLTPNGKLDRRALPAPHWTRADDTPLVVPQTPTEELVAAVWADVLRLPALSRHDDFFALGGHSLLATQVVTRLRAATGADLAIRALFQAPTVAALAAHLDQQRSAGLPALPPPRAMDRPAVLPLAPAQQRLWFLAHWHGPSAAYTVPLALTLRGPLQLPALEHSLDALVARHEPLRTTFPADATGQPAQHIAPSGTLPLVRHDLRHLPATAQPAAVRDLCASALQQPFDLANGPLVRAWLVHLGPQHHQLLLAFHHIIADGWSIAIVLDELAALYRAACQQEPPNLPPLALQYADYALWQQQVLLPAVRDRQLAFWQQHLAGAPPTLDLPADHPRPVEQDLRGATARVPLDPALVAALSARSRAEHVTLFMTLFSAFQLLLLRLTGQTDLVVGTPVANRTQPQLEPLIGFFVNTLALRTDLAGTPTLRALLHHVREVMLDAAAQQDLPFEQVVEALQPVRDPSRAPLVQVMFVLQNVPRATRAWPDLTVTATPVTTATAKFDLTLIVEQVDDGLDLSIEYSTALFTAATVARLAAQYGRVLHAFASDVDQSLWAVPLLSAAEQQQVRAWSTPRRAYAAEQTIHALFAAQAARTPAAIALRDGDATLSYGALEARANQLAHYLQEQGVGPETRVGVCLERGSALIVALLAVLKADGVYVPLDPAYPTARLTRLLDDAQVALVLSETPILLPRVVPRHDLDTLAAHLATLPTAPPFSRSTPDHLAYVIYTSGTTGQPKGVAVPHQGVVRLVNQNSFANLSADEVLLQLAPISFDASTLEIWGSLLNGAQLVIAPPQAPSLATLGQLIREHGVTTLWLTAGLFHLMVEEELESLRGVRQLLAGGDVLSVSHVRKVLEALPNTCVINGYGPTENTTFTCCYPMRSPDQVGATVSIGRPIANTEVHILDREMQLVPIGVTGELYIGGDGLARGYLNQPTLTAERFIPDPFSATPGHRLYRTGDYVRWLDDGTIEFLGRIDDQVKLRGFRIELGEIEHHLLRAPAVRDAVVMVRADSSGTQQLVAYIVGAPDAPAPPQASALRSLLQTQVPDYMIPAAFVLLDALPLTPNGKLDRRALPAPQWIRSSATHFEPPQTPTEATLAAIWAQVLAVPELGRHDNFFELGGHSLLVTQIIARIRTAFDVQLPIQELFHAPTVAALAEQISAAQQISHGLVPTPIQSVERGRPALLSFAQQRLWFVDQLESGSATYNIPLPLRLSGPLDIAALQRSLDQIVCRHEVLRTTFPLLDGQPVQQINPPQPVALRQIHLTNLPAAQREAEAGRYLAAEAQQTFDLRSDLLIRALLIQLSADEHIVLITTHHIVLDGTIGVFFRELAAFYNAFTRDEPATPAPLTVQYADYAAWQRAWLEGNVLETQRAYWQRQLEGNIPILQLPADRPRPAQQSFRGARHHLRLPKDLSEQIKALSRAEGATLFMTLLAAFNTLLHRLSQQDDIAVGTPIATHHHRETEDMLGCFVNTLVLRTDLSGSPSFRTLLQRVRATALGAYLHQDMPFERLVEMLRIERDLSHHPLFQVMFVLGHPSRFELSGLRHEHLETDLGRSRFDLLFGMEDAADGLSGTIEYSTDIFDAPSIERLAQQFETLLGGIVASPDQPIAALPLLTAAERQRMLAEWNATSARYDRERCLHELFEMQAARAPQRVAAIDSAGQQLTYTELNCRANQLAHQLTALGLRAGETVAVYMERSLEMLPALLGILKAGGAYVPLDPSFPHTRIQWIISSLNIRHIVTRHTQLQPIRELCEALPTLTEIICLDQPATNAAAHAAISALRADTRHVWTAAELAQQPTSDRPPLSSSDDLAYIIFTSGSTGTPKGVMVQHRPVINLIEWLGKRYPLGPSDRVLFVTSLSFDLSVYDIFGLLAAGGSIRIAAEHELRDQQRLVQILRDEPITFWDSAPAALQQLVPFFPAAPEPGRTDRLRLVFLSGDWIPVTLPDAVRTTFAGAQVISLGGATEATVWSNYYPIEQVAPQWASIPYGRPIQNAQYFILDAHLEPCPINVPGDLYIAGDCLALGYANDPRLTAEKFIPDPFGTAPGARLYKTGDQARFWPDGTIEFLGRIDSQVKVRGYRIELGEIEAVLTQHPAVCEAIVIAHGSGTAERRLVAYVVAEPRTTNQEPSSSSDGSQRSAPVSAHELRAFLRARLPEYMVPSLLLLLDQMPLTANGKLDRKALPTPESLTAGQRPELEAVYAPPQTPIEQAIAAIWRELLVVGQVGVHDNFFDLGGHSLLLIQVHGKLREQFLPELPITELFNHTTIATLAAYISQALQQRVTAPVGQRTDEAEQRARNDAGRERLNRRRQQRQQESDR